MRQLDDDDELLLDQARSALAAIEMDGKIHRGRVDPIWRAIAADLLNDEDAARWARRIAKNVVRDVLDDKSQDRDDRALKALCLIGQGQDPNVGHTAAMLEVILAFERLAGAQARLLGHSVKSMPTKDRKRYLLRSMRAAGCYAGLPYASARKRLDRLLEKMTAG